jgi:hypothetical protein
MRVAVQKGKMSQFVSGARSSCPTVRARTGRVLRSAPTDLGEEMRVLRVGTCLIVLMSLGRPAAAGLDDRRVADAAKSRDDAAVRKLLSQRADVNGRQPDGATALHWAVHWDDADTVNLLLRAGAGVNSRNELGVTPLSLACANGNAAITQGAERRGRRK